MNSLFRRFFSSGAQVARSSTDSIVHNVKENQSTYGIILAIGFGCYALLERSQAKLAQSLGNSQAKLEESFKELRQEFKAERKEVQDALQDFRELLQPTLVDVQVSKKQIDDIIPSVVEFEVLKKQIADWTSIRTAAMESQKADKHMAQRNSSYGPSTDKSDSSL